MCSSAIRWAGFREYIYGTPIDQLASVGWQQILIPSSEVIKKSWPLGTAVSVIERVGTNLTDPLFEWQYQSDVPCPQGCIRTDSLDETARCHPI